MDQGEGERESGRGRGGGGCRAQGKAGARDPGKTNNFQQSGSVPKVPDPHHLPHTGLVIFSCLCESNPAALANTLKGKHPEGKQQECDTHLACFSGDPW